MDDFALSSTISSSTANMLSKMLSIDIFLVNKLCCMVLKLNPNVRVIHAIHSNYVSTSCTSDQFVITDKMLYLHAIDIQSLVRCFGWFTET